MSTIRISKKLKKALKKLGESGESYQTIVANLRRDVIGTMVEKIASEIYDRESITKKPSIKIMTPVEEVEPYIDDNGVTVLRTIYKWPDGRDDVVAPVIHAGFDVELEHSLEKIKQDAKRWVDKLLRTETMLLSKMGETDHIYLSLPLQILMWGDAEYNIHFTMRTSLTSSATPTFEEACEATKS